MPSFRVRTALLAGGAAAVIVALVIVLALRPFASSEPDTANLGPSAATPSPARTTAVAAPSGGSIDKTVAPAPRPKTYTNGKASAVEIPGEVLVHLISVERHKAPKAIGPGALNDPVAVVSLEIGNKQEDPIELSGVNVTLLYDKDRVGTPVQSEFSKPFSGSLAPTQQARGTYVFSVSKKSSDKYMILVQSGAGRGIAKFQTQG